MVADTAGRLHEDAVRLLYHAPRTATLQGGHGDLRPICCGGKAHDADCENGDYRLLCSLAKKTGNEDLVPTAVDYVADRPTYLDEIAELLSTEDEKQQQREITDNLPRKYQAQS